MIVKLTKSVVDEVNNMSAIHGAVEIDVNGFMITHLKLDGEYVDFYSGDKCVRWAKLGTEVSLKVWKEIVK